MSKSHEERRPARRAFSLAALLLSAATVVAVGSAVFAQDHAEAAGATTLDGVFTAEQVARGDVVYQRECAMCHGANLGGSGMAPPLAGIAFMFYWQDKPLSELYTFTRDNMPFGNAGSLPAQTYADIVALILDANGFPAGDTELGTDVDALAQIILVPAPAE